MEKREKQNGAVQQPSSRVAEGGFFKSRLFWSFLV